MSLRRFHTTITLTEAQAAAASTPTLYDATLVSLLDPSKKLLPLDDHLTLFVNGKYVNRKSIVTEPDVECETLRPADGLHPRGLQRQQRMYVRRLRRDDLRQHADACPWLPSDGLHPRGLQR